MRALLACVLLSAAAMQAATINTTLTVNNATVSIGINIAVSGQATLTNIGSGTFSANGSVSGSNITAPFTITLSNQTDTITGTITIPFTAIAGQSGTGTAAITGGTGAYLNATGSFPTLNITANGAGTNITINITGNGTVVTGGPPAPTITAVLDAAAYTPNIAQGSIFVVKGQNLSASGFTQTSFPLPAIVNGVSINFAPATGGSGTNAYIIYLYNQGGVNQLAAILPSTVATGAYNVTVTNAGGVKSQPMSVSVVASKPGIITQHGTGNGLAVVQNFVNASTLTVNRYTTGSVNGVAIAPAKPGQTEILWVVGMGPVPGGDNTASPGYDFTQHGATVQVILGGSVNVTPFYAGRAPGLSGVDQVNFTLPPNAPTGCSVQVQISVNGVKSQSTTFMAIAPDASSSACVQPGYTSAQLSNFDQGATVTVGGFQMSQFSETIPGVGSEKIDIASGAFTQYTGFELPSIPPDTSGNAGLPIDNCIVSQSGTFQGGGLFVPGVNLDAGKVTLTGPAGSNLNNTPFTETNNTYELNIGLEGTSTPIPGFGNGVIVAGTYTIHGAGGTDVNPFDATVNLGTPLTVTGGLPTSIVRANGIPLAWTGGNPNDLVAIIGSTTQGTGTSASTVTFVCYTTAGKGGFNVPSSVTNQLFAVPTSGGLISVASGVFPTSGNGLFNFTLASDNSSHPGTFTALVGTGGQAAYQ